MLCGLAGGMIELIAFRAAQGLGASGLIVLAHAVTKSGSSHKHILSMRAGAEAAVVEGEDDPRLYAAYSGNRNGRPVMSVDLMLKPG